MSDLQYYNYPGVGEEHYHSQAVRIGDRIECSGQGGWLPDKTVTDFPRETVPQIEQAFRNVDLALKTAGDKSPTLVYLVSAVSYAEMLDSGQGWSQVYKVRSYHLPLNGEAIEIMTRLFKEWMPHHQPLWTCVGITRLGEDDMRVEIEVEAYDPKS